MQYIHIETGEYPVTRAQIRAAHPLTMFPEPFEPCEGYALVQPVDPPAHDASEHRVVEAAPVLVGEDWRQAYELVRLTAHEIAELLAVEKARLIESATAKRWEVETGGVTFPDGTRVATTVDDQNRITAVIANAQHAGVTSVDFKAASGWITLSMDELQGIAAGIAIHVQGCFSVERGHHEAIAALTTLAKARAYDVTKGWPS